MTQLSELVVKEATKTAPRAILALDLKGAFDNVSHAAVLENLGTTGCGRRTFGYIKDFRTKRTAMIRMGEKKSEAVELGDRDTPQGSVLSPLLFKLALLPLPSLLERIDRVSHALYADDITVWTNRAASDDCMEGVVQRAAETVHGYAKHCGLSCAPQKSELLIVQPGRPKKQAPPSVTVTIDDTQIIPTEQIRSLASATIPKIKHSTEQIASMICRVANRKRGLKEEDALLLVQALVVSRVTYSAPHLRLTKADREALDTAMRKATKIAKGLPMYSSTKRLMDMGTHNAADELIEAHLSNQRVRLSRTEHGRALLHKMGWQVEPQTEEAPLSKGWHDSITTKPLPRNMTAERHEGRRTARAEALARQLEEDP
ncbi:uncharacterized protein LOC144161570 [Haemaphysalis longicornis]